VRSEPSDAPSDPATARPPSVALTLRSPLWLQLKLIELRASDLYVLDRRRRPRPDGQHGECSGRTRACRSIHGVRQRVTLQPTSAKHLSGSSLDRARRPASQRSSLLTSTAILSHAIRLAQPRPARRRPAPADGPLGRRPGPSSASQPLQRSNAGPGFNRSRLLAHADLGRRLSLTSASPRCRAPSQRPRNQPM
jgi:hypothetical protein